MATFWETVFPYQHHLLTYYPEPGPQQSYNVAHSRTGAKVEMTIGMFKAQFQCLRSLKVTPERACDIIVACMILHNIATVRREQCPPVPPHEIYDLTPPLLMREMFGMF